MNQPLLFFIALSGAAVLGHIFAWSLARLKSASLAAENERLEASLKAQETANFQLKSEIETRQLALENLQKMLQDLENQCFEKDEMLKTLRLENLRIQEELHHLMENPIEKIKEIDVIREVPILIFREPSLPESRKEKAIKLMRAFKQGFLDESGTIIVPAEKNEVEEI
ncbi:MAG: hypothetical protein HY842_19100 [Bacteroidetes bacterium]|nr:hypothetical protein [Bacteroidota bacterium]